MAEHAWRLYGRIPAYLKCIRCGLRCVRSFPPPHECPADPDDRWVPALHWLGGDGGVIRQLPRRRYAGGPLPTSLMGEDNG